MSTPAVEIVPLTDDQIAAIGELRFVFTNQARNMAIGLTLDPKVAARCPGGVTPLTRARNPTLIEYDVQMAHPHAVALAVEIQETREKERAA